MDVLNLLLLQYINSELSILQDYTVSTQIKMKSSRHIKSDSQMLMTRKVSVFVKQVVPEKACMLSKL